MANPVKTKDGGVTPVSSGITDEVKRFRSTTIQRDYTFLASFIDNDLASIVAPEQIVSVAIPQAHFAKIAIHKSLYPIAHLKYENEGLETRLTIREDAYGSVRNLIDKLNTKARRPDGLFNPPNSMKIIGVQIKILDYAGNVIDIYQLRNMLYLQAGDIEFNHNGSDAMTRELTFSVEDVLRVGNTGK